MSRQLPFALLTATMLVICSSSGFAKTPFEASEQLTASGHITEARRALESELRLRPDHVEARYNLALLLQRINQPEDAAALYRENLSIHWHLPSLINLASLLQQQGQRAEARSWLLKGTAHFRHEAPPWYMLAAMAEQEGHIHQAEQLLARSISADPLNGFAHLRLADFQSRHKRSDRGIKEANRSVALLPHCAPCWQLHGNILRAAGQHREAILSYQKSLSIRPDTEVRRQLILSLDQIGEHRRAARMQQALDAWMRYQNPSPP
ncbi:tetratricopeptide repeat protein [Mariprofundus erugo]|uniref:Tetratricopeptide repeat protein n=2 Tax=Mariprofundus erugo TaxID=2528639 RepID=A0A5R9GSY2_9PROT|nr:tetratricopeptide repeat protein [Mariprofundus erugo]